MFGKLSAIFSKKGVRGLSQASSEAEHLVNQVSEYFDSFDDKLRLFNNLKEMVIHLKSEIFDFQQRTFRLLTKDKVKELLEIVSKALSLLKKELQRTENLVVEEENKETREKTYTIQLIGFVENELGKEGEYKNKPFWPNYNHYLKNLYEFLAKNQSREIALIDLLSCQLKLLRDIEIAEENIERNLWAISSDEQKAFEKLKALLHILEVEIMRFGQYCQEEAKLIGFANSEKVMKDFRTNISILRSLGLLYSEPALHRYNLNLITTKINTPSGKGWGTKGIGIIHWSGYVELRFVKGSLEKHSEVVRMLFNGIPGTRLSDNVSISAYLYTLPLDKITKIAGYQIQLEYDENNNLNIVNIDYASTILEVQIDRRLHGEFLTISKQDFERLNYSLLFSIDKDLLDKTKFKMRVEETGNKINITDQRIFPFS